jgi:type VI secretion system secreted protein VgrG
MDAAEAVSLLKGARRRWQDAGRRGGAAAGAVQQGCRDGAERNSSSKSIRRRRASMPGAVNGQTALKAKSGSRELDASSRSRSSAADRADGLAASINWATPASTVLYAGQHLHWTTQSDLHMTAAHTVSSVAANAASLFTHGGGIQAIAGNGPVSLQAHTDQLEIVADKEITVISVNDCIEIKAKEKIVLQAGQSAITLEGGDITFACPGKFSVKGGKHLFDSGAKKQPSCLTFLMEKANSKLHCAQLPRCQRGADGGRGLQDQVCGRGRHQREARPER